MIETMTGPAIEATTPVQDVLPLQGTEACDLGAEAAYVRVGKAGHGVLDFCKHHFEFFELALIQQGFAVVDDQRAKLDAPREFAELLDTDQAEEAPRYDDI